MHKLSYFFSLAGDKNPTVSLAKRSKPSPVEAIINQDFTKHLYHASKYEVSMTPEEIEEAEKVLAQGLTENDEYTIYKLTRALQRQPKYLSLPVKELLLKFQWLNKVSLIYKNC